MLGLRGVRLGLVIPGLFAMQVRAIAEAAAELKAAGGDPQPGDHGPAGRRRAGARDRRATRPSGPRRRQAETGTTSHTLIGTMIEVPRAALTAGQIAEAAEFFSFGTNDLTQMGWGFSRDDVEAAFFCRYLELGIFGVSPFESLDPEGVGRLVRIATEEGRATRPGPASSASAASTAATPTRSTSSTRSASTTSPARRSASRSPGWRPAGRRWPRAGSDSR